MEITFLNISIPLILGYLLDMILGDPHHFPHPVKTFGWIISRGTKMLNNGKYRFLKGMLLSAVCIVAAYLFLFTLLYLAEFISPYFNWFLSTLTVHFCLANTCLIKEGKAVFKALDRSIDEGRARLRMIVGRDTKNLEANQVRKAVLETMSENLSDGVVAPLFYYALGGAPAMFAYKMVNTLDSMIGYKNETYFFFGKCAARIDDIANFIPARITALLIALVTLNWRSFRFIFKYGSAHASPNSGFPEAALAGYLHCRFGGPNMYSGVLVNKPFIGSNDRSINSNEIQKVAWINQKVTFISVTSIVIIYFLLH